MTQGRCGSLLLHRDGLTPSTPCRSPGALRFTPKSGHSVARLGCPLCAKSRQGAMQQKKQFDHLVGEREQLGWNDERMRTSGFGVGIAYCSARRLTTREPPKWSPLCWDQLSFRKNVSIIPLPLISMVPRRSNDRQEQPALRRISEFGPVASATPCGLQYSQCRPRRRRRTYACR
jgi:hypothetical protein